MTTIRHEHPTDIAAREALLDAAFGDVRFAKTSERMREGRLPADGLSFIATHYGRVIGTVRLWHVKVGRGGPALLLGPLAVAADVRGKGVGGALMSHAIAQAKRLGHSAILLVGDAPYYDRFGFSAAATADLGLPGPYEPHRLLGLELTPGALAGAKGLISATGRPQRRRDGAAVDRSRVSHAA